MRIDGHTRLAAVVANPIRHSLSPFIHNLAFQETGINGVYVALEIEKGDLKETLANVKRYQMFGLNISMPYKQEVLPYLDELSSSARKIGAVNTVVYQNGKLVGHNTDGLGFYRSLTYLTGFKAKGKTVTILGTGGAALAVIAQAVEEGANHIFVFGRNPSLNALSTQLERIKEGGASIDLCFLQDVNLLQSCLDQSDLVVNATSLGMDGKTSPLPQEIMLSSSLVVADLIYQPFETPFLKKAKASGCVTVNGLGMLVFQAAEAFLLFTGREMPVDHVWQAVADLYSSK